MNYLYIVFKGASLGTKGPDKAALGCRPNLSLDG